MKRYKWEQDQLQHMKVSFLFLVFHLIRYQFFKRNNAEPINLLILIKIFFQEYIARFGHGSAKLARQAQSKEKTMAKMVAVGLTEKVVTEKVDFILFCTIFSTLCFFFVLYKKTDVIFHFSGQTVLLF